MRGEPKTVRRWINALEISTHSPRAGRTPEHLTKFMKDLRFQLTRPVRGEPGIAHCLHMRQRDFNSLAPCGANLSALSILSLKCKFQLTRPVRGEPPVECLDFFQFRISTHSPRAGRTIVHRVVGPKRHDFNSLAPCGANLLRCLT